MSDKIRRIIFIIHYARWHWRSKGFTNLSRNQFECSQLSIFFFHFDYYSVSNEGLNGSPLKCLRRIFFVYTPWEGNSFNRLASPIFHSRTSVCYKKKTFPFHSPDANSSILMSCVRFHYSVDAAFNVFQCHFPRISHNMVEKVKYFDKGNCTNSLCIENYFLHKESLMYTIKFIRVYVNDVYNID